MPKVLIERWDDDLAFRLPPDLVERLQLREGDEFSVATFEAELERQFGASVSAKRP